MPLSLSTVRTQFPITVREAALGSPHTVIKRLLSSLTLDLLDLIFSIKVLISITGQIFWSSCFDNIHAD